MEKLNNKVAVSPSRPLNCSARRYEQFNEKVASANDAMRNCSFVLADSETKHKIRIIKAAINQFETAKNLMLSTEPMLDEVIAELRDVPLFP